MHIGRPLNRVDGRAKVTGEATYAAEYNVEDLVYGHVVTSAVARGRIVHIDPSDALRLPGVIHVFTHENTPRLAASDEAYRDDIAPAGSPFRPLHDNRINYNTQPIALVVADSSQLARYASTLIRVEYEEEPHHTSLEEALAARRVKDRDRIGSPPDQRGDPDAAFAAADVRVDAQYRVPMEHHNPMETFATTVVRDADGRLTVYDKTQGVQNVRDYLCRIFDQSEETLRVVSPFVGGAFGSGLRPQYQVYLAVLAARELKRSVRVSLTRQQMFTLGYRPPIWQRVALGASRDGTLKAVIHEAVAATSQYEDFAETVTDSSGFLYRCDNVRLDYRLVRLDLQTPLDMRAPGAASGLYALECAMDELAVASGIDPIELRIKNYAARDQHADRPFSSKELRACYRQAADRFGWARRNPQPRSMRDGHTLIGWGMAGGVWEAFQQRASAKAMLTANGKLAVSTATSDIGTGTYTIMTQIAAERLGLPIADVSFALGDSSFPNAPVEGGSFTASTVGSAVVAVCDKVRRRLLALAKKVPDSPLSRAGIDAVTFVDGEIRSCADPSRAVSITAAMRQAAAAVIEEEATAKRHAKYTRYSRYSHSAVFAEVHVDEDFGTVHVTRVVSAVAGGRILNPKTARSQILGGIVWGIGMALEEESVVDHAFGRIMNHNLAEYHVAVNADIGDIEVIFVDEADEIINPLGAKGLGELGLVGVAAAIANAVFHATGRRVRDLPITLDKLL